MRGPLGWGRKEGSPIDAFEWIEQNLAPRECDSTEFLFNDMESQSGRCLPVIYLPFDASDPVHWGDRGALYDFLHATKGEGKRLLDFGPGDGWPSLIVAPLAEEVVGVDGSRRRVEVCIENAKRIGVENARFIHVEPGSPLPFPDESFDGAMAASSVEQTPDPEATLAEIHRVLRPGGRFRMTYEALSRYVPDRLREYGTWELGDGASALLLYDRDLEGESAVQYRLTISMSELDLRAAFPGESFEAVSVPLLESLRERVVDARVLRTLHPSGRTLRDWLYEVGFSAVIGSLSGGLFAMNFFRKLTGAERPSTLEGVDRMLRSSVRELVEVEAPIHTDPRITAVK